MPLRHWQVPYSARMTDILDRHQACLVTLPTGSGKTYMACDTTNRLGRHLFVACPKAVVSSWADVAGKMGTSVIDITNPESRLMKSYFVDGKWKLPKDTLFVHDEIHRGASGIDSHQTKMFGLLKAYPDVKVLMQSATAADNPMKMRYCGFLLGIHGFNLPSFWNWCRRNGCYNSPYRRGMEFPKGDRGKILMRQIHMAISDMLVTGTVDDIPGFPECSIETVLVNVSDKDLRIVNEAYEKVAAKVSEYSADPLPLRLAARQLSEVSKAGVMADMVQDLVEEGNATVCFLNFHLSIEGLANRLAELGITKVGIYAGGKYEKGREEAKTKFQEDQLDVLICQVAAGGVGINLHADKPYLRPRQSLICPDDSASNMVQALGRIWRTGSYHKAIQKFVLLAGSIEEKIARSIEGKRNNIEALQDSDFAQ